MFTMPLQYLMTSKALHEAYDDINKKSTGIDDMSFQEFEINLTKNIEEIVKSVLSGKYSPEPLKKIEIDKPNSNESRPIALSSIKDKIVQKALYINLSPYFNKTFSENSYAYRPEKSTLKAIEKVSSTITQKKFHIVKTDIDNFFETISHDILLDILDKEIKDKLIIRLISLFLQIGGFKDQNYSEHSLGIYQGDILSPLLSNIYLNKMDKYLEQNNISFVRYADDFILLTNSKDEAYQNLKLLKKFLKTLKLKLEFDKTFVSHINDGFVFLGVEFKGKSRQVESARVQKSIDKINSFSKTKVGFLGFIDEINSYLLSLKNYYLKILTKDSKGYMSLQDSIINSIAHKIYLSKENKSITTKKEFKILLEQINFSILFDTKDTKSFISLVIAKGYEKYLSNKSYKEPLTKIDKKKNKYSQKFSNDNTLHVSTPGLWLGVSKNKFTLKRYGKIQSSYPIDMIKRIILEGKGYSLSSDVIQKCATLGITIDFINRDALSYASLITYKSTISQMVYKQSLILNTPLQLILAKEFIKGKAKNQINYIKYLNKYHKLLNDNIVKIENILKNSKSATTVNELMGYEGSISSIYWECLRLILEVPFKKRITFGAKDIVNSSLNYGYAILYGKIQHSLVHAGLSLNISFLHSLDTKKPTLTFDIIEEFRTFVVDRTIISMLNKDEPIKLGNDGLLTKKSRQLISKNIKEKLGSYTMWKKVSTKVENIIMTQCYNLSKTVDDNSTKYKAFIGKF